MSLSCPKGSSECPIYDEIAALKQRLDDLNEQVQSDFLTNLYNKRHFLFSLEQEMERTHRSGHATTIVLLDIDHFKAVNDTYGHVIGDKVLVFLAELLKETVRKIDVPCRYGGEEFAIILPSANILVGVQVAERIRAKIQASVLKPTADTSLNVTASLGVASFEKNDVHNELHHIEHFIQRADKLLYQAKHSGRNQVCVDRTQPHRERIVSDEEKDALGKL